MVHFGNDENVDVWEPIRCLRAGNTLTGGSR